MNPLQFYTVEFPRYPTHAEGIIIHTDFKEIVHLVDTFQVEFMLLQQREFQ